MTGSFWSFLKRFFWGHKGYPVEDTPEVGFTPISTKEPSSIDVSADEAAAIKKNLVSHTPLHLTSLTALQFYDDNLLDCCITQWKFGDWQSLISVTKEQLEHHPDREKLAILVAAGHFQVGDLSVAKYFTQTALAWGCSMRLVSQILVAGVHNSLGRAAFLSQEPDRALNHFKEAITIGVPKGEATLFVHARAAEQSRQINSQPLTKSEG